MHGYSTGPGTSLKKPATSSGMGAPTPGVRYINLLVGCTLIWAKYRPLDHHTLPACFGGSICTYWFLFFLCFLIKKHNIILNAKSGLAFFENYVQCEQDVLEQIRILHFNRIKCEVKQGCSVAILCRYAQEAELPWVCKARASRRHAPPKIFIFRASEMPFPMVSRGEVVIKTWENANYSVT